MVFDRSQAEEVFERALELDGDAAPTFDSSALHRLADELGVSEAAMSQAIGEVIAGRPGLLNAVAAASLAVPVSEVGEALASFLRLRGLAPVGSTVWEQRSGWWPDLYRFTATTPVAVSVAETDGGSTVRLATRLDRVWRAHLVGALLAPVVLALALLGVGPSASAGTVVVALVWIGAAAWTYQLRREAVRRRLSRALEDVARPEYRLQPW